MLMFQIHFMSGIGSLNLSQGNKMLNTELSKEKKRFRLYCVGLLLPVFSYFCLEVCMSSHCSECFPSTVTHFYFHFVQKLDCLYMWSAKRQAVEIGSQWKSWLMRFSFSIKEMKMAEDAHIGTLSDGQIISSLSFNSGMCSYVFCGVCLLYGTCQLI